CSLKLMPPQQARSQVRITSLRDPATLDAVAAGIFARHQAAVAHQLASAVKAGQATEFGHNTDRCHLCPHHGKACRAAITEQIDSGSCRYTHDQLLSYAALRRRVSRLRSVIRAKCETGVGHSIMTRWR